MHPLPVRRPGPSSVIETAAGCPQRWKAEFLQSIKCIDAEDRVDLFFYRPAGFLFAKLGAAAGASPTQVTLAGLATGLLSGWLFARGDEAVTLIIAAALLLLSGVLDSADGQLARLSGRSTKLGLVLDGVCDNLVFVSVYVGCTLRLVPHFGYGIWALAVLAGLCHSAQSAVLDFYQREFLFFGSGSGGDAYWNPSLAEARAAIREGSGAERWAWQLRLSWIWQQQVLGGRGRETRERFRRLRSGPRGREFRALYRRRQLPLLHLWRPLGANVHTFLIILAASAGHFEWYLAFGDALGLSGLLLLARGAQRRVDARLLAELP